MTEAKFTKGPWVSYGSGVATEAYGLKPDRTYGHGCGATFVCCLNDGEYHEYKDREEQEANAHLISAAPDMYEALEDAAMEIRHLARGTTDSYDAIMALLAKARGEQ